MNNYLKYTSMAIQMGVIIGIFTFIGYKLDGHYKFDKPYLTIVFSLMGVGIALYTAMRDFITPNNKTNKNLTSDNGKSKL